MSEDKKKAQEEAENDFKNKMFEAFSRSSSGIYIDEEGHICIPLKGPRRRKNIDSD